MKLLLSCMDCFKEQCYPSNSFVAVDFIEQGAYSLTCSKGHETITLLQQMKFEVLYEIGAHAILDGYYREAISSFAASLERFYEFSIKVILKKSCNDQVIEQAWKKIASQSERQMGAFVFLWVNQFQDLPTVLSDKMVQLRNSVIHKGVIPTREESVRYGDEVLRIINALKKELKDQYSTELENVVFQHLLRSHQRVNSNSSPSTMFISTIVSLTNGEVDHDQKTLEEHLKSLSQQREKYKSIL